MQASVGSLALGGMTLWPEKRFPCKLERDYSITSNRTNVLPQNTLYLARLLPFSQQLRAMLYVQAPPQIAPSSLTKLVTSVVSLYVRVISTMRRFNRRVAKSLELSISRARVARAYNYLLCLVKPIMHGKVAHLNKC